MQDQSSYRLIFPFVGAFSAVLGTYQGWTLGLDWVWAGNFDCKGVPRCFRPLWTLTIDCAPGRISSFWKRHHHVRSQALFSSKPNTYNVFMNSARSVFGSKPEYFVANARVIKIMNLDRQTFRSGSSFNLTLPKIDLNLLSFNKKNPPNSTRLAEAMKLIVSHRLILG